MIDISAFHLLLRLLTWWLERHERDVLRYLLEKNVCFAASCGADACS